MNLSFSKSSSFVGQSRSNGIVPTTVSHGMGTHMTRTIEISNAVLTAARAVAAREGTTVRALVEEGLRKVLVERRTKPEFRLRKVTFTGRGMRPEVRDRSWEAVRDLAYEGRGG